MTMLKWFLISLLFCTGSAFAQIVDVLNESNAELEQGWSGQGDLNWEQRNDSSSYNILSVSLQNYFRQENHIFMVLFAREYGEQNEEIFSNSSFGHGRYRYIINPDWEWEAFLQYARDPFRRLQSRKLIGSGPKYNLISDEMVNLSFGVAIMRELEEYEPSDEYPDSMGSDERTRLSIAFQLNYSFDKRVLFQTSGYMQPEVGNWDDHRLSNTSSLVFSINDAVQFKASFQATQDTDPPEGVQKYQSKLVNSLVYKY